MFCTYTVYFSMQQPLKNLKKFVLGVSIVTILLTFILPEYQRLFDLLQRFWWNQEYVHYILFNASTLPNMGLQKGKLLRVQCLDYKRNDCETWLFITLYLNLFHVLQRSADKLRQTSEASCAQTKQDTLNPSLWLNLHDL